MTATSTTLTTTHPQQVNGTGNHRAEDNLGPLRRELAPGFLCAAIAHNLLRAAGVLAGATNAVARGATLRRRIVNIPARLARPQRRPILHLPTHWPWSKHWLTLWRNTIGYSPPLPATT